MYTICGILDQWDNVYHMWDFRPMGLCKPYGVGDEAHKLFNCQLIKNLMKKR